MPVSEVDSRVLLSASAAAAVEKQRADLKTKKTPAQRLMRRSVEIQVVMTLIALMRIVNMDAVVI